MALSFQHWKNRWSEGYTVYCGRIPIGVISQATLHAGPYKTGWMWHINNVSLNGLANRDGIAELLEEAKRDMEFSWSVWVSAADLREASNGAPD